MLLASFHKPGSSCYHFSVHKETAINKYTEFVVTLNTGEIFIVDDSAVEILS